MKEHGVTGTGIMLAEQYRQLLVNEPLEVLKPEDFAQQAQASVAAQQQLEASDTLDFETYLASREG